MKFWIVSMECAGIAEAGGVKNVSFSLCKELALAGHSVTLGLNDLLDNLVADDVRVRQVEKADTLNALKDDAHALQP